MLGGRRLDFTNEEVVVVAGGPVARFWTVGRKEAQANTALVWEWRIDRPGGDRGEMAVAKGTFYVLSGVDAHTYTPGGRRVNRLNPTCRGENLPS